MPKQAFRARESCSEVSIDVSPEDNPTSKPEPDVAVFNRPYRGIAQTPLPQDICLLAEISDSTLGFDLTTKAGLYARAAIPEYWVLDVSQQRMIVHRRPVAGAYADVAAYKSDESVEPLAAPGAPFPIGDVFRDE